MNFSLPLVVGVLHTPACLKRLSEDLTEFSAEGIDLLEVRLDGIHELPALTKWPLPVIATARDPKEGGLNNVSCLQREKLLESALSWASLIDIELQNAKKFSVPIARAREAQRLLILSHHDFQKTPSLTELQELVMRAHDLGAAIVKVATMTSSEEEVERLLQFQQLTHPLPVATMGMGPLGKNSRLRLAKIGTKLLYGHLYEPLNAMPASIQWPAKELANFVHSLAIHRSPDFQGSSHR